MLHDLWYYCFFIIIIIGYEALFFCVKHFWTLKWFVSLLKRRKLENVTFIILVMFQSISIATHHFIHCFIVNGNTGHCFFLLTVSCYITCSYTYSIYVYILFNTSQNCYSESACIVQYKSVLYCYFRFIKLCLNYNRKWSNGVKIKPQMSKQTLCAMASSCIYC